MFLPTTNLITASYNLDPQWGKMNQNLLSWDGKGRGIENSVNQSWDGDGRDGEKINHDEEIVAMVLLEMFLSFSGFTNLKSIEIKPSN